MGRPVILGNGALTVGLNESGLVHDFYYPYVGLDNLTTARESRHRIGVWVDGVFSWLDSDDWQQRVELEETALVSKITLENTKLGVRVLCSDFVDTEFNAFCRNICIENLSQSDREVRVFLHQSFQISRAGRGDTALYEPTENYILDYKGRCSLIVYSKEIGGTPFSQYSVGNCAIEGKEGTWRDAEDGELAGNPVEHGSVDSVVANILTIPARGSKQIEYWIIAADSQQSAEAIHYRLLTDGLTERLEKTRTYWRKWLKTAENTLQTLPEEYQSIIRRSLFTIKAHADRRGGVIASCDSSIYNYGRDYYSYVWPRDGAYAMWPLIRLGYTEEPRKFFEFCRGIMNPDGYMMHKYQPDKAIGSTWHPLIHANHKELAIQEDETAIILFMLSEYYEESKDVDFVSNLYTSMIQPMANFMASFRDESTGLPHASYDLWEEKFLTHTYTTILVHRALLCAVHFAEEFQYPDDAVKWSIVAEHIAKNLSVFVDPDRGFLRKGFLLQDDGSLLFDNTLDISSAYGCMMFGAKAIGTEHVRATYDGITQLLVGQTPSGGCPRYEHDGYFASNPAYMGNPWPVATLWVAQYFLQTHKDVEAKRLADWVLDRALESGALSEQYNPMTNEPLSVLPLVWSHAELINTLLDLYG